MLKDLKQADGWYKKGNVNKFLWQRKTDLVLQNCDFENVQYFQYLVLLIDTKLTSFQVQGFNVSGQRMFTKISFLEILIVNHL